MSRLVDSAMTSFTRFSPGRAVKRRVEVVTGESGETSSSVVTVPSGAMCASFARPAVTVSVQSMVTGVSAVASMLHTVRVPVEPFMLQFRVLSDKLCCQSFMVYQSPLRAMMASSV